MGYVKHYMAWYLQKTVSQERMVSDKGLYGSLCESVEQVQNVTFEIPNWGIQSQNCAPNMYVSIQNGGDDYWVCLWHG